MILPSFYEVDIPARIPGDDWRIAIPIRDATWEVGDAAECHFRVKAESATIAIAFSTAAGTIELNPGEIVLIAPRSATALVAPGGYVWDIEATRGGFVETIMRGTATVLRDITRPVTPAPSGWTDDDFAASSAAD